MDLLTVLIILALFGFFGTGPWWGYHHYGYLPSGGFGLIVVILIILLISGRRF
jgi:hypothetical protein